MNILIYILLITFLFLIHIEVSIGNVFYRVNSLGVKTFNIRLLVNYLIEPLRNRFLWYLDLLDCNYIIVLTISLILYFTIL